MKADLFPAYTDWEPRVPVRCLTPHRGAVIHRFFDTSPISPSGRYAALFRLPFEDRLNAPGETGQVVLVDLETGTERVVAETRGWEPQMGANLNWGEDDCSLLFNDVDTADWTPQLVKLDPLGGGLERIPGGVYHVSPDGRHAAAPSLEKMARTQMGYGVRLPEERIARNVGARDDDGLFVTDLRTGHRRLVLSLAEACRAIPELQGADLDEWEIYGFHAKWSPQGDRLLFTIRRFPARGPQRFNLIASQDPAQSLRFDVLTLKPDGSDVHDAVPAEFWERGGHHINWFPDGLSLSMNLGHFGGGLKLVRVSPDGSGLCPIVDTPSGSGHPTVHPDGRHILTDSYHGEPVAFGDGTVPLRWIDVAVRRETCLARIGARTGPGLPNSLRVDPHPAWERNWRHVVFNGVKRGEQTRRVFIADMTSLAD